MEIIDGFQYYQNAKNISWKEWFFHFKSKPDWIVLRCDYRAVKIEDNHIISQFTVSIHDGYRYKDLEINLKKPLIEYKQFVNSLGTAAEINFDKFKNGDNYVVYTDEWNNGVFGHIYYNINKDKALFDVFNLLLQFRQNNNLDK